MTSGTFQRRFFVLAPSYHGATLLARLLSLHPDVVHLGDTYPDNGFDQVCGCGALVSRCPFWTRVKENIRAERYQDQPMMLPYYPRRFGKPLDGLCYRLLPPGVLSRLVDQEAQRLFVADYELFLRAVHGLSLGSPRVFVDGLKTIDRVAAFRAFGGQVDGVIHLTRDPVDFTGSFLNNKGQGLRTLVRGALWWRRFHGRAARLARRSPYLRLSYEALTEGPDPALARVFRFLGVSVLKLEELLGNTGEVWHFMGNSSLFGFDGTIRRSRHHLPGGKRALIRLLAGPGFPPSRRS